MAKTLRADGIYADLVCAIGVDDDGATVKDFTGNQTVTLDTDVAVQAGQYGFGVRTATSGGQYSPRGIRMSPGVLHASTGLGTVVLILNSVTTVYDQGQIVGFSQGDVFRVRLAGSPNFYPRFYWNASLEHTSSKPASIGGMFAYSWDYPNGNQAFWVANPADDFPLTPEYTGTRSTVAANSVATFIGGTSSGSMKIDVFAYLEFNRVLTQSELEEIFGSLSNDGSLSIFAAAADTTAPVLTSPTGTATGETTASGTVSTDTAEGTLYWLASTNTSESAATVKGGSSQVVTATGEQSVSVTGLTAGTGYYLHYVHTDAASNDSTVASSSLFTTDAAPVVVKGVRIQLHDGASAQANLTGLTVAWFDDDDPATMGAPVYQTVTETTDASGWLEVNLDGYTALSVAGVGFLVVYKSGATAADDIVFAGRLAVQDIA